MSNQHDKQCEDPAVGLVCRCYARKLRSVQFGNVTPPPQRETETWRERDLPAYQRLRRQGLQPKSVRHAAELETRAESQLEIEMGKLIAPKLLRKHASQIHEGMSMAREAEYTTADIVEWKKARDRKAAGK